MIKGGGDLWINGFACASCCAIDSTRLLGESDTVSYRWFPNLDPSQG